MGDDEIYGAPAGPNEYLTVTLEDLATTYGPLTVAVAAARRTDIETLLAHLEAVMRDDLPPPIPEPEVVPPPRHFIVAVRDSTIDAVRWLIIDTQQRGYRGSAALTAICPTEKNAWDVAEALEARPVSEAARFVGTPPF